MKLFSLVVIAMASIATARGNRATAASSGIPAASSPAIAASNSTKPSNHTHAEGVPSLKGLCDCPAPNCPSALMNKKSVCECQNAAALACYTKSQGGCPKPKKNGC